jgi:FHA domain
VSTKIEDLALSVVPGDGLVHRGEGVVLVLPAAGTPGAALAPALLDACTATGDRSGRRLARRVAALIAAEDAVPDFALVADTDRGLALLVHGEAEVRVEGRQPQRITGSDSLAWVERLISEPVDVLRIGLHGGEVREDHAWAALLDLRRGTVPGSGVLLHTRPSPPAEAAERGQPARPVPPPGPRAALSTEPPPGPERACSDSSVATAGIVAPAQFESMVLVASDSTELASRTPLPVGPAADGGPGAPVPDEVALAQVEGTLCSRGHFNDPDSAYCSVCGISMQQRTRQTVLGPRPPLGVLVLDDGSAFSLDTDYVIGRDPEQDEAVAAGRAHPLVLNDEVASVSRVHARINLCGWKVLVTDRGAANGTYLTGPEGRERALPPGEPTPLSSGSTLRLGRRSMVFHSYHSGGE